MLRERPLPVGNSGDPLNPKQWYQRDTYYQILEVEPHSGKERNITTSIIVKKRGTGNNEETELDSFDDYKLDTETKEKLQNYYKKNDSERLSSYLPFEGVIFPEGFMKNIFATPGNSGQTELGNFYQSMRLLLQSRKLSQLIAKTWWTYLKAKENGAWEKFAAGDWKDIDLEILDGLIAREIFLLAGGSPPNNPDPKDPSIYYPLKSKFVAEQEARFLILPSSKAWQGITLSLLSSGQAFYLNPNPKEHNKYHQIAESVLSTGEIVFNYCLESDWSIFQGTFKELTISHETPWVECQAVMPYPPIPSREQLDPDDMRKWAQAKDEDKELGFYKKQGKNYVLDVNYCKPPYPYIPLSTS